MLAENMAFEKNIKNIQSCLEKLFLLKFENKYSNLFLKL